MTKKRGGKNINGMRCSKMSSKTSRGSDGKPGVSEQAEAIIKMSPAGAIRQTSQSGENKNANNITYT